MIKKSSANNLATNADITRLEKSTKTYVNKAVKSSERILRAEIIKVEERVENIEERVENIEERVVRVEDKIDSMDAKLDKISNQLDGFVGRVDDLTNDNEIGADQIHELRKTAKDHEERIAKLESAN